jgi:two-component system response regulator NreC
VALTETINIFIVERNDILRKGLAALLSAEKRFNVVGSAYNSGGLSARLRKLRPHILLFGLNPRNEEEFDLLQTLSENNRDMKCIVFTDWNESNQDSMFEAIKSGVHGYLVKSIPYDKLVSGIIATYKSGAYLSPQATRKLMEKYRKLVAKKADGEVSLSPREKEIVLFIARGFSNKQIARELYVSSKTVKTHVAHIMKKLEASNRTDVVVSSLKRSYIDISEI